VLQQSVAVVGVKTKRELHSSTQALRNKLWHPKKKRKKERKNERKHCTP